MLVANDGGFVVMDYRLPDMPWPSTDLVGEFFRKEAILSIIGGMPDASEPTRMDLDVELVPEPDNPHSKSGHAISARAGGRVIGYLSSEDSETWHLPIHRVVASGARVITRGNVFAYQRTKWKNGKPSIDVEINIRVSLPELDRWLPMNVGSLESVALLPWGGALQVTGEEDHLSHLFEYVPKSGQGLVVLTMHRFENTLKNGTVRELVEVRLDGERVGQLTAATSQHFLPTIRHVEDMDKVLGVWSRIKGSGLAVELTVQGVRATDVSDEWVQTLPGVPTFVPEASSYSVPNAYTESTGKRPAKVSRVASGQRPSRLKTIEGGNAYEFVGGPSDEARVQIGKKLVMINDDQRKYSPRLYRVAGVCAIVALVLIGGLLGNIPGIGPILFVGAVALGIVVNIKQRRIATALENEQKIAPRSAE
ncbi:hypothetical protein CGQ24_08340 [Arthrobacter sp. 7749]|nr:hypothetical protein CGQ24_08340 [Arthrobacter sp. 7749]